MCRGCRVAAGRRKTSRVKLKGATGERSVRAAKSPPSGAQRGPNAPPSVRKTVVCLSGAFGVSLHNHLSRALARACNPRLLGRRLRRRNLPSPPEAEGGWASCLRKLRCVASPICACGSGSCRPHRTPRICTLCFPRSRIATSAASTAGRRSALSVPSGRQGDFARSPFARRLPSLLAPQSTTRLSRTLTHYITRTYGSAGAWSGQGIDGEALPLRVAGVVRVQRAVVGLQRGRHRRAPILSRRVAAAVAPQLHAN